MLSVPLLLTLSAGCTGAPCTTDCSSDDTASTDTHGDTGVPIFTMDDPEPEWTAEDVGHTLFAVFGYGFPSGTYVRDTYLEMMSHGDDACVGSDTVITQDFILGCTAASGYYYSGVCVYDVTESTDETGSMLAWGLGGDFELAYPNGQRFGAGGGATYTGIRAPNGEETFTANFRGTWFDESDTNWLGQGFSGLYDTDGGKVDGKPWIEIHGGVGVGDVDLFFDHMNWDWSGTCEGQPVGSVRLRDSRGYWYVWTLDDDCDTCGDVVFHGDQDLGEVCLDLKPVGEDAYNSMAVP